MLDRSKGGKQRKHLRSALGRGHTLIHDLLVLFRCRQSTAPLRLRENNGCRLQQLGHGPGKHPPGSIRLHNGRARQRHCCWYCDAT